MFNHSTRLEIDGDLFIFSLPQAQIARMSIKEHNPKLVGEYEKY